MLTLIHIASGGSSHFGLFVLTPAQSRGLDFTAMACFRGDFGHTIVFHVDTGGGKTFPRLFDIM
jgi:hypothetical protein